MFKPPVHGVFGCNQTGRAFGQSGGCSDILDHLSQSLLCKGEEGCKLRILRGLFGFRRFVWLNGIEISRALRNGLERLSFIAKRCAGPERINRVAENQNFNSAGAETFQLRACFKLFGVFAGDIINRCLVGFQVGDVILETACRFAGFCRGKTCNLKNLVAAFGIFIQALFQDRAKILPDRRKTIGIRFLQGLRVPAIPGWSPPF